MEKNAKIDILGKYGCQLSAIEIGLGSFLHAFHVPLSGIFLSLNQGYILCKATLETKNKKDLIWLPYAISNIAAVLKTLSPVGKKLGPMLSLSIQGLLFNLGVLLFGINPFGLILGMMLLSIWSFVQPLLIYYLFFGDKLFKAVDYLLKKVIPFEGLTIESLFHILLALVLLKMVLSFLVVAIIFKEKKSGRITFEFLKKLEGLDFQFLDRIEKNKMKSKSALLLAFRDLFQPIFLFSIIMTGVFLYWSEGQSSSTLWILGRPIALAFLFFYVSRTLVIENFLKKYENGRFRYFISGCQVALNKAKGQKNHVPKS